ncbi:hypothetical protein TK45_06220 [Bowmanella sp. JS7-9]|nr:hypothetical protein TK45_06220 [Bowmanella sp. JS7-9]
MLPELKNLRFPVNSFGSDYIHSASRLVDLYRGDWPIFKMACGCEPLGFGAQLAQVIMSHIIQHVQKPLSEGA